MVASSMFDFEFSNSSSVIHLDFVKSTSERLPFPMDQVWEVQLAIALLLLVILYQGGKLRLLILKYLKAPDCNGPINTFIWADQINGLNLCFGIIFKIAAILCPFPLVQVVGEDICNLAGLPVSLYIAGIVAWNCAISVFRAILLKKTSFVMRVCSKANLMKILFITAMASQCVMTFFMVYHGKTNPNRRICLSHHESDLKTIELYMVKKTNTYFYFKSDKNGKILSQLCRRAVAQSVEHPSKVPAWCNSTVGSNRAAA